MSDAVESLQIETKRRPDMTCISVIPDYLKLAMERLETAREERLINARHMDETTAVISQVKVQEKELEQENGNGFGAWCAAFHAGDTVITDELERCHLARAARWELAQKCNSMNGVLSSELNRFKGACDHTAKVYRQAHHGVLSQYAEHEFKVTPCESRGAFIRAMKLNILALNSPLVNTTEHQGYIELGKVVVQQVKAWFEQAVEGCNIRPTDKLVLFKTEPSASTLSHMKHDVATTPGQQKVWQEKTREREADLKARGSSS